MANAVKSVKSVHQTGETRQAVRRLYGSEVIPGQQFVDVRLFVPLGDGGENS